MLAELTINNFAIIESISLSFDQGLTVFTGETGAGKSIIIDAVELLAGGRGSADFVRHGEQKAEIEGVFFVRESHPVIAMLKELDIDVSEGMVVLERTIFHHGKSICRVNNKLVTISVLRKLGSTLIDIHNQHEHQHLLKRENHVALLDDYGHEKIAPVRNEYKELFRQYQELRSQYKNWLDNEQEMMQRIDFIQFQLNEIRQADLKPQEEEELLKEKQKLANYERLYESIGKAYECMSADHRGLDWIGKAMALLDDVTELDTDLKKIYDAVASSFYGLEEAVFQLRNKLDELEYDPDRLNEIESRLSEIQMLKRKYGTTIEEILAHADKINKELDGVTNIEERMSDIKERLSHKTEELVSAGYALRTARQEVATELEKRIQTELKTLHMDKTTFSVRIEPLNDNESDDPSFTKEGLDQVEFYLSTNPGEPLKPLEKIASGGELSRIMLALKTIFLSRTDTSIIFDEVDTGVSGRVAQAMAEKIQQLSGSQQVFCITHLPQVAAMADVHLYIAKETSPDTNRTKTTVTSLSTNEKVNEIGRMISGVEVTELTKKHAEELIDLAAKTKSIS